jgi:phage-related protein (TIGR01555 family)
MFNKLKTLMTTQPAPLATPTSVFTTDLPYPESPEQFMQAVQRRVFPRTHSDLKVRTMNGAMDSAPCSGLGNSAFNIESTLPEAQMAFYANQSFIGYQNCAMLFQNWLIEKACSMPARDAIRHGWEITSNDGTKLDPKTIDKIRAYDVQFKLTANLVEFVRMGRCFGIRIAMFLVNSKDKDYYKKPFNIDGVTPESYLGISQIDPYWVAPILDTRASSNPAAPDFYEPTWWLINDIMVHKSHLIIFRPTAVPDVLKPAYLYGGISVPQKIYERVYAAERTANEAPLLAMTKRTTALHVDLSQAGANEVSFMQRIMQWVRYRDNYGIKLLGQEDQIEQFDTSLADLDAVIMTQYQIVAAAAGVPATKLLGTTPKGFNSTGEFEEASYHEELESIQEHDLTPLINRHHQLVLKSFITEGQDAIPNITVTWNELDSPTSKEMAEINEIKARTGTSLINAGALPPEAEYNRLVQDPDSGYSGMPLLDQANDPLDGDDDEGDEDGEEE